MFTKQAKAIAELQAALGQVDADGKELNQYGLEVGFALIANILLTLATGLALGMLLGSVVYTAVFFLLRRYSGGFHMRGHLGCMIVSVSFTVITLCLAKLSVSVYPTPVCVASVAVGGSLILLLSPVESVNKPLDATEVEVYRKRVRIVLLSSILCVAVLIIIQLTLYAVIVSFVVLQVGFSVLLGRFFVHN